MQILIVGCGRVGSKLAEELISNGEDLIIIDQDEDNLENVQHLDCVKIHGMPLEMPILEKAGISAADVVLCLSGNENMNVMVGQIALKVYHVPQVIVRIYNPENENVYQALGMQTISSTSMTIEKILQVLGFSQSEDRTTVLGYPVHYDLREVTETWNGKTVNEVEHKLKVKVLAVANDDSLQLVSGEYAFETGERVVLVSLPEEE